MVNKQPQINFIVLLTKDKEMNQFIVLILIEKVKEKTPVILV